MFGADFLQTLFTAIVIGSLYALVALGYTMVYGILKFINFAHSDIFVLGAWVAYTASTLIISRAGLNELPALANGDPAPIPLWVGGVTLLISMAACGLIGFLIERLAYKPLRRAPRLNVLITAIGVSLFLQNAGQLRSHAFAPDFKLPFGAMPQAMPKLIPDDAIHLGIVNMPAISFTIREADTEGTFHEVPVTLPPVDQMIIVSAVVLMILLELLVYRTKFGLAMRAVSFSVDNAALMGVPVSRVISTTFVLGSSLAAAGGFLWAVKYGNIQQPAHETWLLVGLKAFVAAVVGGIGNIRGAFLGGFLIAGIEMFGMYGFTRYLDPLLGTNVGTNLRDVYVFAALILVLLVRPSGMLGSTTREKV